MYRKGEYNELVAKVLQEPLGRKEYILGLIEGEDGLSLFEALKHSINSMGITEFARELNVPRSQVSRTLSRGYISNIGTLNKYLAVFGLRVKLEIEDLEAA